MAGVNPWDSSVQGGDAAWEGLRVYRGKILSLERHLRRLFKSAKALGFQNVHTKSQVMEAIFRTLAANGMRDGAHMRLTLTRGEKCTSSMNPKFNVYGTTLIILPEWKPTEGATTYDNTRGISLITSAIRRNPPSCVDSKIHHNNMINNILPKIQANLADAADAIMLDLEGFVSETNATNIFMVDNGTLLTPHADYCLPGITRETVLILAKELGIPCEVRRVSLSGKFSICISNVVAFTLAIGDLDHGSRA
jgi:branched-subunit amino acid aminotransferase/4-amino-4-deoxychorismate lyase